MKKNLVTCLAAVGLILAGCADTATDNAADNATDTSAADATGEAQIVDAVILEQGSIRAKPAEDAADGSGMTSIFGTLRNTTDEELSVIGFTTSLGQASYQIHEVVDGVMREKDGGFVIPGGGTHELAPGGDHFMVMDYAPAIEAGDTVDVTLLIDGGATVTIPDVAVRTMLPGHESYGDLGGHADHEQHNQHKQHNH